MAWGGVDDQASRFVEHDHVVVFKNDREGNILRFEVDLLDRRNRDADDLSRSQLERRPARNAVDEHVPIVD
jgi:hypothetical protein